MASKAEIKMIEEAIEGLRNTNPNMANGLITALGILTGDDQELITTENIGQPEGSFSYALNQMYDGKSVRLRGWPENDYMFYKNGVFVIHSFKRGREVLNDVPMNWFALNNWVTYEKS